MLQQSQEPSAEENAGPRSDSLTGASVRKAVRAPATNGDAAATNGHVSGHANGHANGHSDAHDIEMGAMPREVGAHALCFLGIACCHVM